MQRDEVKWSGNGLGFGAGNQRQAAPVKGNMRPRRKSYFHRKIKSKQDGEVRRDYKRERNKTLCLPTGHKSTVC